MACQHKGEHVDVLSCIFVLFFKLAKGQIHKKTCCFLFQIYSKWKKLGANDSVKFQNTNYFKRISKMRKNIFDKRKKHFDKQVNSM